jgi:hypothetical protein
VLLPLLAVLHATETSWQAVAEQEMVTATWAELAVAAEVPEELIIGVCLAARRAGPTQHKLLTVATEQRVAVEVLLLQ